MKIAGIITYTVVVSAHLIAALPNVAVDAPGDGTVDSIEPRGDDGGNDAAGGYGSQLMNAVPIGDNTDGTGVESRGTRNRAQGNRKGNRKGNKKGKRRGNRKGNGKGNGKRNRNGNRTRTRNGNGNGNRRAKKGTRSRTANRAQACNQNGNRNRKTRTRKTRNRVQTRADNEIIDQNGTSQNLQDEHNNISGAQNENTNGNTVQNGVASDEPFKPFNAVERFLEEREADYVVVKGDDDSSS